MKIGENIKAARQSKNMTPAWTIATGVPARVVKEIEN